MNLTIAEVNSSSIHVYEYLYSDVFAHVMYYVVLVTVLIFGPLLCIPIVLYETFGGDRQKRTIINRLSSFIFSGIALQSCIWSILRILRDIFGLFYDHQITPVIIVSQAIALSNLYLLTEITILRFLYIVVWKRMKMINDEFWNVILTVSTNLMVTYFAASAHLCGDNSNNMDQIIDITHYKEQRYIGKHSSIS